MSEAEDGNEPYVYIHIPPLKTGDRFTRETVPAVCLKKFSFDEYQSNPDSYKDKIFKFKRSPESNVVKCYVLHAAETFMALQQFINQLQNKNKRLPIPKSRGNEQNKSLDSTIGDLVDAKLQRKGEKKRKLDNKKQTSDKILNAYTTNNRDEERTSDENFEHVSSDIVYPCVNVNNNLHEQENLENSPITSSSKNMAALRSSQHDNITPEIRSPSNLTVLSSSSQHDNNIAVINALKMQIDFFRKQSDDHKKEAMKWKTMYEELKNSSNHDINQVNKTNDKDMFFHHDWIYNRRWYSENERHMNNVDEDYIILRKGIKCKSIAYKDAYKHRTPSGFITSLSVGIYGRNDFANRCVRVQKNTPKNHVPLDPKITEVIDEELYNFMRCKGFTLQQIDEIMGRVRNLHHGAITTVRAKLERERKVDSVIERLEEQYEEYVEAD